jgi:hypothetical protein
MVNSWANTLRVQLHKETEAIHAIIKAASAVAGCVKRLAPQTDGVPLHRLEVTTGCYAEFGHHVLIAGALLMTV